MFITKTEQRLLIDEDAVITLYKNNGYLFPISIHRNKHRKRLVDLELRVTEGPKATIKRIIIQGNDRVYEDVIRRELEQNSERLQSDDLIRSIENCTNRSFRSQNLQPTLNPILMTEQWI